MSEGHVRSREQACFELLARVADLPADEREAILGASDPALADEVRSILDGDANDDGFLQTAVMAGGASTSQAKPAEPIVIGPYRVVGVLGEGGMGRVFLAEQEEPVRRRVALKVLRFAFAGHQAQSRFIAERHAMGRLDHPNVGKILEAGATADGSPFFAMELIEGQPITKYCDQSTLDLDQRLRIFVEVCRGADHAHSKLLLHRDLKPSNVLVTEIDGLPVPKIIDFGIAKGLDSSLAETTIATGEHLVGTPAYMSPEALGSEPGGADLDVRSDVYALGVLLYELLTGVRPHDTGSESLPKVIRRITENDAPKPSTKVSLLGTAQRAEVAALRQLEPGLLPKRLHGDLDRVVMKAMARDRKARYGSAAELAADIDRFRQDLPISARPPSFGYLLRKLVRRHRLAASAVVMAVVAIAIAVGGLASGLGRARVAERQALAEAVDASAARDEAEAVVDFLQGLFQRAGPFDLAFGPKPVDDLTALDLLARGAAQAAAELKDQPVVRARLHEAIGLSYQQLGRYDEAKAMQKITLDLRRQALGESDPLVAQSLGYLGQIALQQNDVAAGQESFRSLLSILDQHESADQHLRLRALDGLGRIARRQGDYAEAERLLRAANAVAEADPAVSITARARLLTNLAIVHYYQGRHADSETLYRRAIGLYESAVEPGHAVLVQLTINLAGTLVEQGRYQQAVDSLEAIRPHARARLGEKHVLFGNLLGIVADARLALGEVAVAEAAYRDALAIQVASRGARNPRVLALRDGLAKTFARTGRREEAEALLRQGLATRLEDVGPEHPDTAISLHLLGMELLATDRREEGRALLTRALTIRQAKLDADHPDLVATRRALEEH